MIKILMEELWNEDTEALMKEARRLCEDRSIIGILMDKVFTYVLPGEEDPGKAAQLCKENMAAARSAMPDFTYQPLDDCGIVYLNNGLICTYLTKEEA